MIYSYISVDDLPFCVFPYFHARVENQIRRIPIQACTLSSSRGIYGQICFQVIELIHSI